MSVKIIVGICVEERREDVSQHATCTLHKPDDKHTKTHQGGKIEKVVKVTSCTRLRFQIGSNTSQTLMIR